VPLKASLQQQSATAARTDLTAAAPSGSGPLVPSLHEVVLLGHDPLQQPTPLPQLAGVADSRALQPTLHPTLAHPQGRDPGPGRSGDSPPGSGPGSTPAGSVSSMDASRYASGADGGAPDNSFGRPPPSILPKFGKEDGDDYDTWAFRFFTWAEEQGLWELYILPYVQPPDPGPDASAEETYQYNSELQRHRRLLIRAYQVLVAAMDNSDLARLLMEFKSANGQPPQVHEAWLRLEATYVSNLESTYYQINMDMMHLSMQSGEEITSSLGPCPQAAPPLCGCGDQAHPPAVVLHCPARPP